jgi:hypothetical protein
MKALYPLWRLAALAFWRWAANEIDPLHPDLPRVVLRKNDLEVPL